MCILCKLHPSDTVPVDTETHRVSPSHGGHLVAKNRFKCQVCGLDLRFEPENIESKEYAVSTWCGHFFGNICLDKLLKEQDASKPECPECHMTQKHTKCGHLAKATQVNQYWGTNPEVRPLWPYCNDCIYSSDEEKEVVCERNSTIPGLPEGSDEGVIYPEGWERGRINQKRENKR